MDAAAIHDHFAAQLTAARATDPEATLPLPTPGKHKVAQLTAVSDTHLQLTREGGAPASVRIATVARVVGQALRGGVVETSGITSSQNGPVAALLNALPCVEVVTDRSRGTISRQVVRARAGYPPSANFGPLSDVEQESIEGRPRLVEHLARERDRALVQRKKALVLQDTGRLACEVCGFDFAELYGKLGEGFAEAHHIVDLAHGERASTPDDLAIVCANCHRIIHRGNVSLGSLRSVVERRRAR